MVEPKAGPESETGSVDVNAVRRTPGAGPYRGPIGRRIPPSNSCPAPSWAAPGRSGRPGRRGASSSSPSHRPLRCRPAERQPPSRRGNRRGGAPRRRACGGGSGGRRREVDLAAEELDEGLPTAGRRANFVISVFACACPCRGACACP